MSAATRLDPDVTALLRRFDHPLAAEINAVRRAILGVSPAITEGIKWNAPSFRTTDYFATIHLRSRDTVQLILHRDAKPRSHDRADLELADPQGLVRRLAPDRCMVDVGAGAALRARRPALVAIIRQWIGRRASNPAAEAPVR